MSRCARSHCVSDFPLLLGAACFDPFAVQNPLTQPPPSLSVGELRVVKIEDIAFGGDGVGRLEGFVVFVPFVVVGETV